MHLYIIISVYSFLIGFIGQVVFLKYKKNYDFGPPHIREELMNKYEVLRELVIFFGIMFHYYVCVYSFGEFLLLYRI